MALTKEEREALPESEFAVPGKRALPIHDSVHVRMAWKVVDHTGGLSDEERRVAKQRILHKAHALGVKTEDWTIRASFTLEAMALDMPDTPGHVNKMPFSGDLCYVDKASDLPPTGAKARVLIPKSVAEAALPTLLGMGIDCRLDLKGHAPKNKIGIITEAWVEDGFIRIKGFLYAKDFPAECALIQSRKKDLGFSYEAQTSIEDMEADPWVVASCEFTGAAILLKKDAAYTQTALAAQAAHSEEIEMDEAKMKELLAAALVSALKPVTDQVTALATDVGKLKATPIAAASAVHDKVKMHAGTLRTCASAMMADGIGTHHSQGHAAVLNRMADHMEAESTVGRVPHIYRDHSYFEASAAELAAAAAARNGAGGADLTKTITDAVTVATKGLLDTVEGLKTQVTDLKAAAAKGVEPPARRTVPQDTMLLVKQLGLEASADKGFTEDQVNTVMDTLKMPTHARIEGKLKLQAAGLMTRATAPAPATVQ